MTLPAEEVIAIAHLARLALTDGEIEALRGELAAILGHVAALGEVDTDGVEPMTHAMPMTLRLREDVAAAPFSAEVALADAPATRAGGFEVPAVIRGE